MATVVASDSIAEAKPRKAEYLDWDLYRKDYKAWHARERRRKARVAKRAADAAAASTVDPDDEENDAQGIRKAAACAEKLEARRKRRVAVSQLPAPRRRCACIPIPPSRGPARLL